MYKLYKYDKIEKGCEADDMQQTFKCYRCGAQNYVGQPVCWHCQSPFQYNCPNCKAPVEGTLANCPYCRSQLPWQTNRYMQSTSHQTQGEYYEPEEGTKRKPWLIGIITIVLIIFIGGGTAIIVSNSAQKPLTEAAQSQSPTTVPVAPTNKPPVISNIQLKEADKGGLIISWVTDTPASSQVQYGVYPNLSNSTQIQSDPTTGTNTGVIVHSVILTNLTPLTQYIYRVISTDKNGNQAVSADMMFQTATAAIGNTKGIPSPKAYKPVKCDVEFSVIDVDSISWSACTLIFKDSTTQKIEAGKLDMVELKTYYVYWVPDKDTLQATVSFSEAVGQDRGILAIVTPGYLAQPPQLKATIVEGDQ